MAEVPMLMPSLGESVYEATIISWLKKEGDSVDQEDSLLEVATDKVDTEIPCSYAGTVKQLLHEEGAVVKVGDAIAMLEVAEANMPKEAPVPIAPIEESITATGSVPFVPESTTNGHREEVEDDRFYSPLVKSIAEKEGISLKELSQVPGTGKDNRVTKEDILAYVKSGSKTSKEPDNSPVAPVAPLQMGKDDEVVPMDRVRKMIAQRMVESKRISPHVTSMIEADVTEIVQWRERIKKQFEHSEGQKFTFMPLFIAAVVSALRKYPAINASITGDSIVYRKEINIGLAVALANGNLVVPVIHHADQLSLRGLAKAVNELAKKARNNELTADELSRGTYTITNLGSFGNTFGTPIIVQPQVAILATGAILKTPAVVETAQGDFIAVRHKLFLSHTYDHRVVDGALGGLFLKEVADYLEGFDTTQQL